MIQPIIALKAHRQISKKGCFNKYYSCDIGNLEILETFGKTNNWQQLYKQSSLTFYKSK